MASGPITSWEIDGETVEIASDFILGGSKITADGDCSHEIKRRSEERRVGKECSDAAEIAGGSCEAEGLRKGSVAVRASMMLKTLDFFPKSCYSQPFMFLLSHK